MKKVVASMMLLNQDGEILLSRRKDNGLYCPPGGKVDADELVVKAGVRELQEETGIITTATCCTALGYTDSPSKLIFFFLVTTWKGQAQNLEPKKHEDWKWMSHFPSNNEIVEGLKTFKQLYRDKMYDLWRRTHKRVS